MVKVSVIIPIYLIDKSLIDMTERSLKSLHKHSDTDIIEVIIVDDENRLSDDIKRKWKDKWVDKIISRNNELGYTKANNLGVNNSNGEYIMLMGNDVILDSDIIFEFLKKMEDDPRQILGGSINSRSIKGKFCEWIEGHLVFTSRKIWDELNGFDEDFFIYAQDVDLCERAKERGIKLNTIDSNYNHLHAKTTDHTGVRHNEVWDKDHNVFEEKWKE